jgi:hypothetical protein
MRIGERPMINDLFVRHTTALDVGEGDDSRRSRNRMATISVGTAGSSRFGFLAMCPETL